MSEMAGTVLLCSQNKRAYLYVCQTAARMEIERANARAFGVQDLLDFVFEFEGQRFELSYEELLKRIAGPPCIQCGGIVKSNGGICMACVGEGTDSAATNTESGDRP